RDAGAFWHRHPRFAGDRRPFARGSRRGGTGCRSTAEQAGPPRLDAGMADAIVDIDEGRSGIARQVSTILVKRTLPIIYPAKRSITKLAGATADSNRPVFCRLSLSLLKETTARKQPMPRTKPNAA